MNKILKRIRNVFTGEQEIEIRQEMSMEALHMVANALSIAKRKHDKQIQYKSNLINELRDNNADQLKEIIRRGKCNDELIREKAAVVKELSDLAIDYFVLHDIRDKMIRVMEQYIPGHVNII